jgi:hypothetical protein
MKISVEWSDLIIEEGKLDPLGLWRVSDRLATELLSPFTTVVTHRPARYFSMYAWVLNYLNSMPFHDLKTYWKKFYQLEAVLLCAIQLHDKHNYDYFKGQIGSESAKKILSRGNTDVINFSKIKKIQNGWEPNYKNSMYQFRLIETDFGSVSNIRVTDRGKRLAACYDNAIKNTKFYKSYLKNLSSIPVKIIKQLSEYSCTCLLHGASDIKFIKEKEAIINNTLKTIADTNDTAFAELLSSISLIYNCMESVNKNGYIFDMDIWYGILSTGIYGERNYKKYKPPDEYKELFAKWEIYTFELILVYSLEAALSAFLEYLHSNNGYMSESDMKSSMLNIYANQSKKVNKSEGILIDKKNISTNINHLINLKPVNKYEIEYLLINKIESASDSEEKMFYAFLLYLYVQANFIDKRKNNVYSGAIKNYSEQSNIDGRELSLIQTTFILESYASDSMKEFFESVFMTDWIIQRQLSTRFFRGKEVAWLSYNNELKTYNWESTYNSYLYRASRLDILMTYLLNLDIVQYDADNKGWLPNLSFSFYKD